MKRAVVVGSGIGGLTAARLLQQRGFAVTVLEQHYRPGGMMHRFFRDAGPFDTGFHYCGGVGKGQALGQVFRHLGVFDKLTFVPLDPDGFDVVRFPGVEVRLPAGWGPYTERICEAFPASAAGIREATARMRRAVKAYGLYHLEPFGDVAEVLAVEGVSVDAVLRECVDDPRARAVLTGHTVLYGVPPEDAPFGLHALIMDHFLAGPTVVVGGGDKIGLSLTRAIRAAGGSVLLRTPATAIEVVDGLAVAVRSGDRRFEADVVISNLHPRGTLALLPESATRPAYRSRVAETRAGYGHLGVYLTVEGRVEELGRANFYGHPTWERDGSFREIRPGSSGLYFACSPTEHVGPPYPPEGRVLMLFPMGWSQVSAWADSPPDARPPEYLAFKQQLLETAIERLCADFPTLRGRVRFAEASTPLSTAHYTRSPEGATYGHYHSVDQMGRNRPSNATKVKNLRMVGQGVFSPGILGASLSAYYAVGQMFDDLPALLDDLRSA